jgi:hypothetical protein
VDDGTPTTATTQWLYLRHSPGVDDVSNKRACFQSRQLSTLSCEAAMGPQRRRDMIDLHATAEKLKATGGRVWIASEAVIPHIRVYWEDDYVRVDETDDGYTWAYVGRGSIKRVRCIAKVEAAL